MKGILRRANYTAGLPVVEGFMLEGFNYRVLYVRLKYTLNPRSITLTGRVCACSMHARTRGIDQSTDCRLHIQVHAFEKAQNPNRSGLPLMSNIKTPAIVDYD